MKKLLLASLGALAIAQAPTAVLARPMTAEDLATFRRIAAPTVSPDGKWAVYQLRETDLAANKGKTDLYLLDLAKRGAKPVAIASAADKNEHDPKFSADGQHVYYLSNASGSDQLWRVALPGGAPEQVTDLSSDIAGFVLSPAGDRIAVWADKAIDCADFACTNVAAKPDTGSARTYDQLFTRHWDSWRVPEERSRIFTFALENGKAVGQGMPVTGTLVGDAPSKPFGGAEEVAFSPDGKTLFFALREAGRIEPLSTNLDIFSVPADGSAQPVNLTDANDALDNMPTVSPDGQWLAYVAMKRPGYEADRTVLHLRNLATGETRALTEGWDRAVGSVAWAANGKSLIVTAGDTLDNPAFSVDATTGKVTRLTKAGSAGNIVPLGDGSILLTMNSIQAPDDLYRLRGGKLEQLTAVNADKLAGLDKVAVKRFSFKGANGDTVWGQIVKPADAKGKLPVAYLVHGGPQGSFGDGWSYRWNPWLFSAPGYAAVTVDFHGSTGYGQEFTDSINKDWGGKPLQDLKLGLAAAGANDASVDISNACALGGSYGGYMMNWIAGNWADGFKCLINHAGVFDARAMAYETEELWFDEWEHGGPYFQNPAEFEKWNPVNHVTNWKTPMLVIHGEKDFRIPYTQGLAAFTALQRRNVPSRLVMFPDENHWILKPKNSIQWYGEVFDWLGKWTGKAGK
ncbi:S9 family peptidase [Sphingomonas sp. C3-2]|uniref:S9 family peptidase n=1 Tax=Sphingomonas sp. C3-2 TaxID=3062169 RepID=UPI00294B4330|nr:S9 family peptidase [Sphingomonas sp. C3-2]WOK36565.1 S9 family peptidase [Sphingomonas sp. C3-2]